ncbi:galactose-3-O-sulfotransferase 2-like isoform X2 [Amphiura filiformis]|uniref:galactose-3-O-sulfotransferase 2-like isoform X2 n=1 Tax=Amphiura filiformis TaxID=82378 RepID=UPI003B212404
MERTYHRRLTHTKIVLPVCVGITTLAFMVFVYYNPSTERHIASSSPLSILRSLTANVATISTIDNMCINSSSLSSSVHGLTTCTTTPLLNQRASLKQTSESEIETNKSFKGTSSPQSRESSGNRDDGKYKLINEKCNTEPQFIEPREGLGSTLNPVDMKATYNPITKIVYIKTHKTGSTTVASIFQRFGYHRNLSFALPKTSHIFNNNNLFSRKFITPWPAKFAKSHPHYDMLVNHAIYNRPELDRVIPNATYVTILRDPVPQLESAFGYFEMAKGMGLSKKQEPFEIFMNNPLHYYTTKDYNMKTRSRNGQLFDLGFDPKLANDTKAIRAKIDTIDKEFDLVMITEYFDESLILLKKLLCWSFDDILYISNGIRSQSHRNTITDDLKKKIRLWNAGDVLLYNHFNETFWRKVKEYGSDFKTDLEKFRLLDTEVFNKCIDKDKVNTKDKRVDKYTLNPKQTGTYCQDIFRGDIGYTPLLRKQQKVISAPQNATAV